MLSNCSSPSRYAINYRQKFTGYFINNKGVKALDAPDIGHVVRESPDIIVVFGRGDERYDIPINLTLPNDDYPINLLKLNYDLSQIKAGGSSDILWMQKTNR